MNYYCVSTNENSNQVLKIQFSGSISGSVCSWHIQLYSLFFPVKQEEEAEYSAYQAKKRAHLSDTLSQISPTKLGGRRLDDSDLATMREKQEKEARLAAKFESIRKRVSF